MAILLLEISQKDWKHSNFYSALNKYINTNFQNSSHTFFMLLIRQRYVCIQLHVFLLQDHNVDITWWLYFPFLSLEIPAVKVQYFWLYYNWETLHNLLKDFCLTVTGPFTPWYSRNLFPRHVWLSQTRIVCHVMNYLGWKHP